MSTPSLIFSPAYRLTVHVPIEVDATETEVLTPPITAPHQNPFQVATMRGIPGFLPYLDMPSGIKQQFDPTTGNNTIGSMNFTILDTRLGTSNQLRWATAFIGDGTGTPILMGRWVSVEESLNAGKTWSAFYAGRITKCTFSDVGHLYLEVACDNGLTWPIFTQAMPAYGNSVGARFPSGSSLAMIVPNGLSYAWGPFGLGQPPAELVGAQYGISNNTWEMCTIAGVGYTSYGSDVQFGVYGEYGPATGSPVEYITFVKNSRTSTNIVGDGATAPGGEYNAIDYATTFENGILATTQLPELLADPVTWGPDITRDYTVNQTANEVGPNMFGQFRIQAYSIGYYTYGEFTLAALNNNKFTFGSQVRYEFGECFGLAVSASDAYYQPVSAFTVGDTSVMLRVVPFSYPVSEQNPVFLSGNPAVLMQQAALGFYGFLNGGTPIASSSINGTAFANLATGSFFPVRYMVTEQPQDVRAFFKEYIYWSGIGYTNTFGYQSGNSGKVLAYLTPFDNRLPTQITTTPTSGIYTLAQLTDDDVSDVTKPSVVWQQGTPLGYIIVTGYEDQPYALTSLCWNSDGLLTTPPWGFDSDENAFGMFFPNNITGNPKTMEIDAKGFRYPALRADFSLPDTTVDPDPLAQSTIQTQGLYSYNYQDPANYDTTWLLTFAAQRFAGGPETVTYRCRRTPNVSGMTIGQYIIVSMSSNPDPYSDQRGTARMMQITEMSHQGGLIDIGLIGVGSPVYAPSCGWVSASVYESSVDNWTIGCVLTGSFLTDTTLYTEIDMALLASGTSQPPNDSNLWRKVYSGNPYASLSPTLDTVELRTFSPGYGTLSTAISGVPGNMWAFMRARCYYTNLSAIPSPWAYYPANPIETYDIPVPLNLTATPGATSVVLTWDNDGDTSDSTLVMLASPSGSGLQRVAVCTPGQSTVTLSPLDANPAGNPHLAAVYHVDHAGGLSLPAVCEFDLTGTDPIPPPVRMIYIETSQGMP